MKKLVLILLGLLSVLVIFMLIKTFTYPFRKLSTDNGKEWKPVKNNEAIKRFSGGIQIPTVSSLEEIDYKPFEQFKQYLKDSYPEVYDGTENYEINTYGLVFKLKGSQPNLQPILFLSHMDVVPPGDADIKDENKNVFRPDDKPLPSVVKPSDDWDFSPFSGAVANGRIYGRGTIDMKGMLFSLMESMSTLVKSKYVPKRDIYCIGF